MSTATCDPKADTWCTAMSLLLHDDANARRAGLAVVVVTNLETGSSRTIGVAAKKTSRDRGVMLNCCPWCRADLAAGFAEKAA
jgi:hypothetical protein